MSVGVGKAGALLGKGRGTLAVFGDREVMKSDTVYKASGM